MIINEYHKQFYTNKLDNLHEMEKFLERHTQLKLTQGQKENWVGQGRVVMGRMGTTVVEQ